ncbi:sugar kinase [Sphingomonas montanisoli]|uniref:Sugar kinase n=1 Tax=Sphingomonas montanisoli TaxID=2606412 RepID=A0A5D9C8B7_9SPHN|nr:sugar kinase [Sphingomonas montanisoli]TZG27330.1 sugar kinase [Sphingomonas montanisoli]
MTRLVAFGELLVRLSPPDKLLLKSARSLDLHVGGAEANVAIGLASLGHDTAMLSRVADNALGQLARGNLLSTGVDCAHVATAPGRMGLYFLTPGAGMRPSDIVYDRAGSTFALAGEADFDWDAAFAGATHLHLSGITPALGPKSAAAAIAAAKAAKTRGMTLIFDGNYRARLWEAWDSNPRAILTELIGMADILFGNHRDIALLLDRPFSGDGSERRREAALAGFGAFPNLKLIASTARHVEDADSNRVAARIDTRDQAYRTEEVTISGIVDRIGAGDAFAAGVLHGLLTDPDDIDGAAQAGLALTALKHSLPGDASLFGREDIATFLSGELDVRR